MDFDSKLEEVLAQYSIDISGSAPVGDVSRLSNQIKQLIAEAEPMQEEQYYHDAWGEYHNVTTDAQRSKNELRLELKQYFNLPDQDKGGTE